MKQVETFAAVCSRLDSVKLDVFQALGLVVSTTPRHKRKKKNLLIICPYFILWFYNVCPPVCNIKKKTHKKMTESSLWVACGPLELAAVGVFVSLRGSMNIWVRHQVETLENASSHCHVCTLYLFYFCLSSYQTLPVIVLYSETFSIFFFLLNSQLLLLCV